MEVLHLVLGHVDGDGVEVGGGLAMPHLGNHTAYAGNDKSHTCGSLRPMQGRSACQAHIAAMYG